MVKNRKGLSLSKQQLINWWLDADCFVALLRHYAGLRISRADIEELVREYNESL